MRRFYVTLFLMAFVSFGAARAFGERANPSVSGTFSGAYLAGRVAGSDQNMEIALTYFKEALQYQPKNVLALQDLLLAQLSLGELQQAVPVARTLKDNPAIERFARLVLFVDAFNKRHYKDAVSQLRYKQPSDMDRLAGSLLSAWSEYARGNRSAALAMLKQLHGPVWFDLFQSYQLALMNGLAGRSADSEAYFKRALSDEQGGAAAPDTFERIITSYAAFLLKQHRRTDALTVLRNGELMLTGRSAIRYMREAVEKGNSLEGQISTVNAAVSEIFYNLGTAINRDGAESFARLYLQLAIALDPKNYPALYQLAGISTKLANPENAAELYSRIPVTSPYFRDARLRMALTLGQTGKVSTAVEMLNSLYAQFKDDHGVALSLASLYMQEKRYRETEVLMDAAIARISAPQNADWLLFYQRGISRERLNEWESAETDFRKALQLQPDDPQVLNYLGYSLIDRNMNLDEALSMVRKAATLRPNDGYIVDSLGWAYYKLGRYSEAVDVLERAVLIMPQDATINDHLGDAYWHVGRKLEATFQWNHALDNKPEPDEIAKIKKKLEQGLTIEAKTAGPQHSVD